MSINLTLLLAALAAVESRTNDAAVGLAGERGRHQITAAVWAQHADKASVQLKLKLDPANFATDALDPVKSAAVGTERLIWLCRQLEAHKQPVTPETLAAAWKSPESAFSGHLTAAARDRAARVKNLYDEAVAQHAAAEQPAFSLPPLPSLP